jgi:hypothetical protein
MTRMLVLLFAIAVAAGCGPIDVDNETLDTTPVAAPVVSEEGEELPPISAVELRLRTTPRKPRVFAPPPESARGLSALRDAASAELPEPLMRSGKDLTCGAGNRRITTVEAGFTTPESSVWHPGLNRFFTSYTAYLPDVQTFDGFGWLGQSTREGAAYYQQGGVEVDWTTPVDVSYATQCGFGVLGSPLGLTVDSAGRIIVVEGGRLDFDDDPATPEQQSLAVFDIVGGVFVLSHYVPLPTCGANDVAVVGTTAYVTDTCFSNLSQGNITKVIGYAIPGAAVVPNWQPLPDAPNPIIVRTINGSPHLIVATLGTVFNPAAANNNGRVVKIRISDRQVTVVPGVSGIYDGLTWAPSVLGGGLLLADLANRKIQTVNPTTGAASLWADLSPYFRQLGGITTDGVVGAFTVKACDFRGDCLNVK